MRVILIALTGLGFGLLVGGLLAFVFGGWVTDSPLAVSGLGPFNGSWAPADYCFAGALLSAVGSALAVGGWLGLGDR